MNRLITLMACLVLCLSCTRAPLKERSKAMRPSARSPELKDDLSVDELILGIKDQIRYLSTVNSDGDMIFGSRTVSRKDYVFALQTLLTKLVTNPDPASWEPFIFEAFDFYEVYGSDSWGEVLLSSYYEPDVSGSLKKTVDFSQPLLRRPEDLVEVAISKFDDRFAGVGEMRGRMVRDPGFPRPRLSPYFTREEIDAKGVLKGKRLEICWVSPLDAFFIQIQGSGTVRTSEGQVIRLGYSDQNGHKYQSIGKFLTDVMPLEKINLHSIENYFLTLPKEKVQELLFKNPSYVFFDKREGPPLTMTGAAVIPGRTIATDERFFPKGSLAILSFQSPVFASPDSLEPASWERRSRIVFDHDKGGGIRGGGRVDLFWGSGHEAKRYAGVIKGAAKLQYLVPKTEWLVRARNVPSIDAPSQ